MSEPSKITEQLIALLKSRDAFGQEKYKGTTLDREDLTIEQWLQHFTEELLDGAGYAQAAIREIAILRAERDAALAKLATASAALTRLRDCDWVITPANRMDGVREIAREALDAIEAAKEAK